MKKKKLKNYEIYLNPIGKGRFGKVYMGQDLKHQRKYAIKKTTNIPMAKHEAFVMQNYGSHPLLPSFYNFFIIENKAYIVMEYFPGTNIGDRKFNTIKTRSPQKAIHLTLKILKALQHLHQKGFAHHDILPQNILFKEDNPNQIRIIDFGLTKQINNSQQNKQYKTGDLSGVAIICLYLLVGFLLETPQEIDPFINGIKSETKIKELDLITPHLKNILSKGVHPNPKKRYHSAEEFIKKLKVLL
ncbi:protein kinase family protein [Halobacteroides halobius DSM 5150]|uniref:Protein kinase family protein n=1 Tax=Halobacteroides halobius (strain ATCC 35273 / DSM 5150 / MD-1) TaxID=748449 RepID=L0K7F7_HALHC|nr:protein kinase [Halobacteroides halobius]AGB41222.1 protein kinase family protein [Halobacteroides halobius DSM 5150]